MKDVASDRFGLGQIPAGFGGHESAARKRTPCKPSLSLPLSLFSLSGFPSLGFSRPRRALQHALCYQLNAFFARTALLCGFDVVDHLTPQRNRQRVEGGEGP